MGRQPSIWDARHRAPRCGLPEAMRARAAPCPLARTCPCLTLLPVGFAWPELLPAPPVVSYTTFSPLPLGGVRSHALPSPRQRRCAFCGTVPSGRPAWPLASTALCGVRTFLIPIGTRLPDQLGCNSSILDCGASVKRDPAMRAFVAWGKPWRRGEAPTLAGKPYACPRASPSSTRTRGRARASPLLLIALQPGASRLPYASPAN